jgi:hypothetical protein
MRNYLLILLLGILSVLGCKNELPEPYNPYDEVIYNVDFEPVNQSDPNSLTRTHDEVFQPKCNVLGCHDGSFEPDFRTPQSTYSTLVYHSIIKNNALEQYEFRVVPGDTANSVLWQRITDCCFVNENDRMPQDNIGISMPQSAIDQIGNWIMTGAPDLFGNTMNTPNSFPTVSNYGVYDVDYDTSFSANRVDDKWYMPFIMPENMDLNMVINVEDDQTPNLELLYNKIKISTDINDFSNAIELTAICFDSEEFNYPFIINFNSSIFESNQQYFMRYYTSDTSINNLIEFPENEDESYYKSIWSFIVQ